VYINRTQAVEITPGSDGVVPSAVRDVVCSDRVPFVRCQG